MQLQRRLNRALIKPGTSTTPGPGKGLGAGGGELGQWACASGMGEAPEGPSRWEGRRPWTPGEGSG